MNLNELIAKIRVLVGYLGESNQFNWRSSSFYTPASMAYLSPIYPRTVFLAQYNGVCAASRKAHDEHIGVGKTYHLYRLPDAIERNVFRCIQDQNLESYLKDIIQSSESAIDALSELVNKELLNKSKDRNEGPTNIGVYNDEELESSLLNMVVHYIDAFENNYKCFPYLRES